MISRFLAYSCRTISYTIFVIFCLVGVIHAQQTGEKVINANDVEQIHDAVLISGISVAGKAVECGLFIKPPLVIQPVTPFKADSDWLRHLTISLVNRTNKTIVFGSLIFHFLDTGDCQLLPCVGANLTFGKGPPLMPMTEEPANR